VRTFLLNIIGTTVLLIGVCILVASCAKPSPAEPDQFIVIKTFYKTSNGADLLNIGSPNSFKKDDIMVVSEIERNGIIELINYDDTGFGGVIVDNITGFNALQLIVPTNWSKQPIKTLVKLSKTVTDTLTYTFDKSPFDYLPNKIYYNKVEVWDIANAPPNANWPPITIIK
jgi:hypothetical protein